MSALARTTDPKTSHEAARKIRGYAAAQRATILAVIRKHPGETARELAKRLGWETSQVNRRTVEMEGATIARGLPAMQDNGRRAATWYALSTETE